MRQGGLAIQPRQIYAINFDLSTSKSSVSRYGLGCKSYPPTVGGAKKERSTQGKTAKNNALRTKATSPMAESNLITVGPGSFFQINRYINPSPQQALERLHL